MGILDGIGTGLGELKKIGSQIPIVGGLIAGPQTVDPKSAQDAYAGFQQDASALARQRKIVQATGGTQVNQSYVDPLRQQQQGALGLLTGAANGTTPSQAVIAGQNAANRAAAQQFGLASAMQGRSPGAALNAAQNGSAQILGQNAADMAAARAGEMATARQGLVTGLQGVRGQEQDLGTTNANLNVEQQKMLLAAQLQAMGYSADMIKTVLDAQNKSAASTNAYNGSILSGISSVAAAGAKPPSP